MEFKGTKEEWSIRKTFDQNYDQPILEIDSYKAGKEGIITVWSGQGIGEEIDDEIKANALLISKAPEMLEELNDTIVDLKILKSNILDALRTDNRWEGMDKVIQKWIDRKEQLIKEATEL